MDNTLAKVTNQEYMMTVMGLSFFRTPLMLAVAYGHIDAVSLLLEKEASVDAADILGCTALHRGVISHFILCFCCMFFQLHICLIMVEKNTEH